MGLQRKAAIAERRPRKHEIANIIRVIPGKNVAVSLNNSLQVNVINTQLKIFTKAMHERAADASLGFTSFVIIDLSPDNGSEYAMAKGVTPKMACLSFIRPIARYVEMTLIWPTMMTPGSDGL